MKVLVINAGSSSLKYQLINMENELVLAKGSAERIGIDQSSFKHMPAGKEKLEFNTVIENHVDAIKLVLGALTHLEHGVIGSMNEISSVGHRVVHGGETFSKAMLIDKDVLKAIQDNIVLAPLHNPANIMGIEACMEIMPDTPMVAVFDTAFHQSMPKQAYMYALPYEYYEKYGIRRYGFHGTSHKYVAQRAAHLMGKDISSLKVVSCHLGNGSSIAAIKYGNSTDTSMGFTPLEGLPMGTRCGSIDPAIIPFLIEREKISAEQVNNCLNKSSGMLGISGISSDFRDLEAAVDAGNERAALAIEVFSYAIKKYIGAYAAVMGGLDCLIFTAGVGENNPEVRRLCCEELSFLGIKIDEEKNKNAFGRKGYEGLISVSDSKIKVFVIPTNEELMIARETAALI
jgi:acetate kinase